MPWETITAMRVLRVSHSAVVDAWRERERVLRSQGLRVRILSARTWDEGGRSVRLVARPGEDVQGVRTFGRHPALFLFDPRPLWRALGEEWDVLDVHEEPYALATAEVLALRRLRRALSGGQHAAAPYILYSAQNIAKRYPVPFRWLERRALRGASAISVCNEDAGRIARAKGLRGRVEVIPLGFDPALFRPGTSEPPSAECGPGAGAGAGLGPVRVGYAGRLARHKGVHVLLDAVAGDPRIRVAFAGAGPDEAVLRERARPLGDRVEFLGPLDTEDLPAFYRSVDVLAVPSIATPGWVEQFGRVAVEAMACGTPVVASETGALPDVVGGAGLLVAPDDPEALRAALVTLGTDPALRDRLGRLGLARAATSTWQAVAERYRRMYEEIAPRRPAQRGAATGGLPAAHPSTPDPAMAPPEVVVVAFGSPDLVRTAIAPLARSHPVTVVDNSSLAAIRAVAADLGAVYLDPGRNGGFCAGVNHALAHRQTPGTDVLLLNPDATISPDDVDELHRALRARADLASVGPTQTDGTGAPARTRWPFPSPARAVAESVGLGRRGRPRSAGGRGYVIGSVLLLRAEAIEDVGGFDEDFFLYAEETDWAYRAHRRGWRHVVVPTAVATHLGGATSSDPVRREVHFVAAQERYLRKHFGAVGWAVARVAGIIGQGLRGTVRPGPPGHEAARRARLYLRGPVHVERRMMAGQARVDHDLPEVPP